MQDLLFKACIASVLFAYFLQEVTKIQSKCFFNTTEFIPRCNVTKADVVSITLKKNVPARIKGRQQKIPYFIHQTNEKDEVPSDMAMAIESLIENNPEYTYRYYNSTERREFLKNHMGQTVLACYDKLIPNAYKADLWRYSVIYTYGGCYMDVGTIAVANLRDVLRSTDTFVSTPDGLPPNVSINSAIFCSTAKNPVLNLTIPRIVQHVANSQYGESTLDITGPWTFRKSFAAYLRDPSIKIAQREYLPGVRLEGVQYLLQCRTNRLTYTHDKLTMVLTKYPRYGEDMPLYVNKTHYSDLYRTKQVYNESVTVEYNGTFSIESRK